MIESSSLPLAAQVKLAMVERQADDSAVLAKAVLSDVNRLEFTKRGLVNQRDSSGNPDDSPLTERIAAVDAEVRRVRGLQAVRTARARDEQQLVVQIKEWLVHQKPNVRWEMAPSPDPALTAIGVHAIRVKIAALAAERELIEAAPLPVLELQDRIRAYIAGLAGKARPKIRIERGMLEVLWPAPLSPPSPLSPVPHPAATLAAWLTPDRLYDALVDELTAAFPKETRAYGVEERANRSAEIETELLTLQYAEEAVVADRVDLPRRPYANPMCVLGIRPLKAIKQAA
jgi:hypothetical protein